MDTICHGFGQSRRFCREIFRPRNQATRRHVDVFGKCTRAVHPENLSMRTKMGIPAITPHTFATWHQGIADDACSRLPVLHFGPHFGNCATKLMAHHQRRWATRALVFIGLQFTAADTTGGDFQFHLIGQRRDFIDVVNFQMIKSRVMQGSHGDKIGVPLTEGKRKGESP